MQICKIPWHLHCLTSLHNRVRHLKLIQKQEDIHQEVDSFVIGEIVSFTGEQRESEVLFCFKQSDIGKMYQDLRKDIKIMVLKSTLQY